MDLTVLLNDGMDKEGLELFSEKGIKADTKKRSAEELIQIAGEYDSICVRSATKITKEMIEAGVKGKLKVIGRAGVGYDNIDVTAANENGIAVKIAPNGNTNSTAELALALMFDAARNISRANNSLKNSRKWIKKPFTGIELAGKTLGIFGCGRIGQRLSEMVSGLNMKVIGYDVNEKVVRTLYPNSRIEYTSKENILKNADFISIHAGGKEEVIGVQEFVSMNHNVILINAARGPNVNNNALYTALSEKWILGAGLDTYPNEPKKEDEEITETMKKLATLENVVMTTHLGASTKEAQRLTSIEMAKVISNYLLGTGDIFESAINLKANVETEKRKVYPLHIYHRDVPGAFKGIDEVLEKNGINIRENPSRQIGDGKVTTIYQIHQEPTDKLISELNQLSDIVFWAKK
ncbi:Glyoxylate reductase [uncultured archaeon]|nr:Glyoxylate reductase [uncultured archaeon]